MNNEIETSAMHELCDYMLAWTLEKYEQAEGEMSPEVYDRAVSVIGLGVPFLSLLLCLAGFVACLGAFWKGVRK